MAADVAECGRVFDLDDLGAEVGKVQGAEGTGAELLDRDDAHPRERSRAGQHRRDAISS